MFSVHFTKWSISPTIHIFEHVGNLGLQWIQMSDMKKATKNKQTKIYENENCIYQHLFG